MSKPVTKLALSKFRGASQPFEITFDPAKRMTLVFGENGTGKSSIVDGIDAICNNYLGSMEYISTGPRNGTRYVPTMGSNASEVVASLFSDSEQWTVSVLSAQIRSFGPAGKPRASILRRDKILELITAQPAKRYEALQKFIDVEHVQRAEESLNAAFRAKGQLATESAQRQSEYSAKLKALWEQEGRKGDAAEGWAKGIVAKEPSAVIQRRNELQKLVQLIDSFAEAKATFGRSSEALIAAKAALQAVQDEIARQPSLDPQQAIRLVEALDKTKRYVELETTLDKCPVCLRPIGHAELLSAVSSELNGMSLYKELNDRLKTAENELGIAENTGQQAVKVFQETAKALCETTAVTSIVSVTDLHLTWPAWSDEATGIDTVSLGAVCKSVSGIRDTLESESDLLTVQINQYNSLKLWVEGIEEYKEAGVAAARLRDRLEQALALVREKRIAFTQAILDEISDEANRLYQRIHPGEFIGLSKLEMDTARKASVNQKGNFHGYNDVPPQAVLSESHMDTLGFCVWLALVKKDNPQDKVVIVDDIFTSVDSVHLTRIVELLDDECAHFRQFIVTTHFRNWWQRYLGGTAPGRNVELIELGRWTFERGIQLNRPPLTIDELKSGLSAPFSNRQNIAAAAGILLERSLDQITEQFGCRVARNARNEFTLSVLLDGSKTLFSGPLRVKLNTNWANSAAETVWQEKQLSREHVAVKDSAFVRNQVGCHYNAQGLDIADADVIRFGELTLALVEPLICPKCGMIPRRQLPDGTGYRCQCNNLELRPLSA